MAAKVKAEWKDKSIHSYQNVLVLPFNETGNRVGSELTDSKAVVYGQRPEAARTDRAAKDG